MKNIRDWIAQVVDEGQASGHVPGDAMPVLVTCRDGLCFPIRMAIAEEWGMLPFFAGAMGGLPTVGVTGLRAIRQHVPTTDDGVDRIVFFVLPHIGVRPDGDIGKVVRRGQQVESAACGALCKVLSELDEALEMIEAAGVGTGHPVGEKSHSVFVVDALDIELSLLRQRIAREVLERRHHDTLSDQRLDLQMITEVARDLMVSDVEHLIRFAYGDDQPSCMIASGILVHLDGRNVVEPHKIEIVNAST